MTVNQKIISALSEIGVPVTADFHGNGKTEYITFDFPSEDGADFGDDAPYAVTVSVAVHWFLPMNENYLDKKNQIRNVLFDNGFTFPEVTYVTDPDENIRHVVFECEIVDDEALVTA